MKIPKITNKTTERVEQHLAKLIIKCKMMAKPNLIFVQFQKLPDDFIYEVVIVVCREYVDDR